MPNARFIAHPVFAKIGEDFVLTTYCVDYGNYQPYKIDPRDVEFVIYYQDGTYLMTLHGNYAPMDGYIISNSVNLREVGVYIVVIRNNSEDIWGYTHILVQESYDYLCRNVERIKEKTDKLQFDANNYVLSNVADKGVLNDPSAENIAMTVDQYLAEAHGSGSWEGASANEVADAVWDEAVSEHQNSGSFGDFIKDTGDAVKNDVSAIKTQTNKLQFDDNNNVLSHVQDKGILNDPSASEIASEVDNTLSANHGAGSWEGGGGANVWDELVANHQDEGTFGALVKSIWNRLKKLW